MTRLIDRAEQGAEKLLEDIKKLLKGERKNSSTGASDEELIKKLRNLDAEYKNMQGKVTSQDYSKTFPESLGLTPKEFVPETEDELIKKAEEELLPGYQSKVKSENLSSGYKLDKLALEEESLRQKETYDNEALNSELAELLRRQQAAMIRQGIVNSSINTEGQREISEYGREREARLNTDYDLKYRSLAAEVEYVNATYQKALKEYDLKYAADLEKKIASLKLQQEKRLEEINKYNLNLAKQEEEYRKKRLAEIAKEEEKRQNLENLLGRARSLSESAYGYSETKQTEYDNRYQTALDFYLGLNEQAAKRLVGESAEELAGLLGEKNYLRLYNEVMSK